MTGVHIRYDPRSHLLGTRITVALEPTAIPLVPGRTWNMADPRPRMNDMLAHLIAQGVRAQMARNVPIVGPKVIMLDAVADV